MNVNKFWWFPTLWDALGRPSPSCGAGAVGGFCGVCLVVGAAR